MKTFDLNANRFYLKDLKIGVKWPNDIFYENQSKKTHLKLGGDVGYGLDY